MTEEQAQVGEHSPIGQLEALAKVRVPLHVVMGMEDDTVPPDENGELLVSAYRELGGPVTAWRKPGAKHHPHGLDPVAPLQRALLRGLGVDRSLPSCNAVPSVEFRGQAAGWGRGETWLSAFQEMRELARSNPELRIVFLGDSITQGLTGHADRIDCTRGIACHRSISQCHLPWPFGDRTEHLLYRIEHGALRFLEPSLIVLNIGVNNVNAARHSGNEVARGLQAVVALLLKQETQAKVLICGPFPTAHSPTDPKRMAIDEVHEMARELGQQDRVTYMDLRPLFLDKAGAPNELMRPDAIHITPAGQAAWMEAVAPHVERALPR